MSAGSIQIDVLANTQKLVSGMNRAEKSVKRFSTNANRLLGGFAIGAAVKKIVQYGDEWSNVSSRLKLVSSSSEEFLKIQTELLNVAQNSRSNLSTTIDLYSKLARGTKELGMESQTLLDITETISKTLAISGASTTEANSSMLQFSQGMASGVLRGEELNSVMENTPRLAQAIADGLKISIGQLRAYGKAGKLSTEVVMNALKTQSKTIKTEFETMPQTVSQSFVKMNNAILVTVGQLSMAFNSTAGLSGAVDTVTSAIINSKDSIMEFGAFASSVIGRTVLLFKALGGTIYDAIMKKVGGSEETNKMWKEFLGYDITDQAIRQLYVFKTASKGVTDVLKSTGEATVLTDTSSQLDGLLSRLDPVGEGFKLLMSDIKTLNESLDSGTISGEKYAVMLENSSAAYAGLFKETADGASNANASFEALTSATDTFRSSMISNMTASIMGAKTFSEAFKSVAKAVIAQLIKILIVQQAVNAAMSYMGFGAGGGGAVGVPMGNGAAVAGYAASGGITKVGGSYLVGEKGPEIVTLPGNTNVTPNNAIGTGGATVVNVYNNTNSDVSVEDNGAGQVDIIINAIAGGIMRGISPVGTAIESRYGMAKV